MFPRLLITPLFTVHTFGLLLATAYVVAFWWLIREGRREGLEVDALSSLGFWAIGGAILGAKALLIARDFPEYAAAPSELFSPSVLSSAGDFYGGFIGALVASAIFFFRHPAAGLAHSRPLRPGDRPRPGHRPHWVLHGG